MTGEYQPPTHMPRRRRLIPPVGAILMTGVAALPIWWEGFSTVQANRWSLASMILVFSFIAALFYTMRARMVARRRTLTVFGQALVDYFTALVVLSFTMIAVWSTLLVLSIRLDPAPDWLSLLNRALISGSGTLIVLTGAAVFYELHRAGNNPSVHLDDMHYATGRGEKP